ncbi:bifunctional 3-(3-hydroxy-phenyl)propionate/3-hydroxycinnamic acid hydroxylase [Solicola sp. PLA-1-18]|uniref:bifunctional 3-(3-hydroxy-phenyl)propionate/3-hydroxycinnamic acid hydroxylase MhpA n=1 Tax=Solicola sp. PLA-1-18 TaxID=3380532 RepID=UPI003B7C4021
MPLNGSRDTAETAQPSDVAVVGFGPVGKLLAILLARQGHRITVVDRQLAGYPLPRAVTHDSEFARTLQAIGLAPDAIPEVTEPYDDLYVWRNHDEQVLLEVDWSGRGSSGWFNTYFFHQPDLEAHLDAIVDGLDSVEVLRGWEAAGHVQHDEHVEVELTAFAPNDGPPRTLTARYLIGADGAASGVRRQMGAGWNDLGYFHDWLVVDVLPADGVEFPHVAAQRCDITRPSTMVPGGPGRRRWEFMRLPHETRDELNSTATAWGLLEPYGLNPGNAVLERHSVYTFQAAWADTWRVGRVMIAGDAAHLMPPFAGQGLGAGFRDAMNLAWKLDLVLRGIADDALLDSYGTERIPHVREFIDFSMRLGQLICVTDPDEAARRDERMIAERAASVGPPAPPLPTLGPGAHEGKSGGTLMPQPMVVVPGHGGSVRLDEIAGHRSLLVLGNGAQLGLGASHLARMLGVHVLAPDTTSPFPGATTTAPADELYAWLAGAGASAALVRPDRYLFGTAARVDEVDDLVDRYAAALGAVAHHR